MNDTWMKKTALYGMKLLPLGIFCGFLPYFIKFPYIYRAWQTSPLDRFDPLFLLLFLLMFAVSWNEMRRRAVFFDWTGWVVLLPALAAFAVSWRIDLHFTGGLSACLISWCVLWLLASWRSAWCVVPTFALLFLTIPSTRYWLSYFSGALRMDGLNVKLILAGILLLWQLFHLIHETRIHRETFYFFLAALLIVPAIFHSDTIQGEGSPYLPDFSSRTFGIFLGREISPTREDLNFFRDAEVKKYRFASDAETLNVMRIACGKDVHQIHPPGHCLRSAGWMVSGEHPFELKIGRKTVLLTEIVAEKYNSKLLMWFWFSNEDLSVGNFLAFRRAWKEGLRWNVYLISSPVNENLKRSRETLELFLRAAPEPAGREESGRKNETRF